MRVPTKKELAQALREYPTWGHAYIAEKDRREELEAALRLIANGEYADTAENVASAALRPSECVCAETSTRNCPVHAPGVVADPEWPTLPREC